MLTQGTYLVKNRQKYAYVIYERPLSNTTYLLNQQKTKKLQLVLVLTQWGQIFSEGVMSILCSMDLCFHENFIGFA